MPTYLSSSSYAFLYCVCQLSFKRKREGKDTYIPTTCFSFDTLFLSFNLQLNVSTIPLPPLSLIVILFRPPSLLPLPPGFLSGETSQYRPALYRDQQPFEPPTDDPDYNLNKDLANNAISYIEQHKTLNPDKPWFIYLAPGKKKKKKQYMYEEGGQTVDSIHQSMRPLANGRSWVM